MKSLWTARRARRLLPLLTVLAIPLSGCAQGINCTEQETKAQCEKTEAHQKHVEQVEGEAHEVEKVIKGRQAEETANAIERAVGGHE